VLIVTICEGQPASVTTTEYVPLFAVIAGLIDGYCSVDVKPSGPDHANVDPGRPVDVRFNEPPEQIGELLPTIGKGVTFTETTVDAELLHIPRLTVTE
jgi:hypothetical protein